VTSQASTGSNGGSICIGHDIGTSNDYSIAIGMNAEAGAVDSIAIGRNTTVDETHTNSVALGVGATTTAANQIMLGTSSQDVNIPANLIVTGTLTVSSNGGNFYCNSGNWETSSDIRLKNINGEFVDGLDKITQIKTYNYTFKEDEQKTPHVGIIAQELQKVFPNSVMKDAKGFLMIRQEEMFYAMMNSIKQLDKMAHGFVAKFSQFETKIVALINIEKTNTKEIKKLKAKNKSLKAKSKKLEARLAHLEKKAKAKENKS